MTSSPMSRDVTSLSKRLKSARSISFDRVLDLLGRNRAFFHRDLQTVEELVTVEGLARTILLDDLKLHLLDLFERRESSPASAAILLALSPSLDRLVVSDRPGIKDLIPINFPAKWALHAISNPRKIEWRVYTLLLNIVHMRL